MSTKHIPVLLYWGGCIIETLEGVSYDRPSKWSISMVNRSTYEQLLEKLYKVPMVARQGTILRLTCRNPVSVLPELIVYGEMEIETDQNVEAMLNSGQIDLVNYVDLFLEFRSTSSENIENDSQVVNNSTSSSEPFIQRTNQFMRQGSGDEQINRIITKRGQQVGFRKSHICAGVSKSQEELCARSVCSITKLTIPILVSILLKLSVNILLACRCVCKTWRNVLSHPEFAKLNCQKGEVYPLVRTLSPTNFSRTLYLIEPPDYKFSFESGNCNWCVECDISSPMCDNHFQRREDTKLKIPLRNPDLISHTAVDTNENEVKSKVGSKRMRCTKLTAKDHKFNVANSCNGLLCLSEPLKNNPVAVCNPTTGEYTYLPPVERIEKSTILIECPLGFSPENNQYKVIRMSHEVRTQTSDNTKRIVEVNTIGTNTWRRIGGVPFIALRLDFPTYLNGAIHWLKEITLESIVVFTLADEKFKYMPPPPRQSPYYCNTVSLGVLRSCLCICDSSECPDMVVWVMKDYGVQQSWTTLVRLNTTPWGRAFLYFNPATGVCKFLKLSGIKSKFEEIAYIPSFVSLKDAVNRDDLSVLKCSLRHAGLVLQGETKPLFLKETNPKVDPDFDAP